MKTETQTIESKGYVATAAEIERLAEAQSNHINASRWQLPATYLRALVATTQDDLGIKPKRNPARPTDETLQMQLEALAKTHEVFYEAVQKGAARAPMDAEDTRDKSAIVASRIIFARSAYSTVRNWILRGRFGLDGLNPKHATKRQLYEQTPRAERVRVSTANALEKQADKMLGAIKEQAKTNREAAIGALQAIINALSRGFDDLGLPAIDIRDAVEHTATQVIQLATARLAQRDPEARLASRTVITPEEREALAPRRGRPPKYEPAHRRAA